MKGNFYPGGHDLDSITWEFRGYDPSPAGGAGDALLMEDGFYLLQEDGSKLLLDF